MSLNDTIRKAMRDDMPSVNLENSLRTAIQKMSGANATALIVKSGEELVGIVTETDVMHRVANDADLDEVKVSQLMTACELITSKPAKTPCVQLDENESIKNALAIMYEAGIRNLLVSGAGGQAIGVVSARDLLKLAI
jgi:CBS domain-containing protein